MQVPEIESGKLPAEYYLGRDVVWLARDLLGKRLVTYIGGIRTSGIITETEAYSYREKGCHAYAKKQTQRNKVMFGEGGKAYVYLCYGIHELFNIVTNLEHEPEAVLIRAIYPAEGLEEMLLRRKKALFKPDTFAGPGKVSEALGITRKCTGLSLCGDTIWLEKGLEVDSSAIEFGPRIGIDYAGEDAGLPWRFQLKGDINVLL